MKWPVFVSDWILAHAVWLEFAIITAGAILRIVAAGGTYLNPDEALHYVLAHQENPLAVYRASLTNAHPPLYFLLLYFWRFLGSSELFLRLPSVIAGVALIAVAGRWMTLVAGKTAGFAATFLVAFSPTLIALSAEVRGYSLLLLWMALALYCLERALRGDAVRWIVRYSLFLWLAILTHYSALWFTIALGVYVLLRLPRLSAKARVAWMAFQAGTAGIYLFLYVTHISRLHSGEMQQQVTDGWLRASYYQPGAETPVRFFARATVDLFQFLFAQSAGGFIALAAFTACILGLVVAKLRRRVQLPESWPFALLLILPFALTFCASILRVYPYGGTRHDVFLILFAIAAGSLTLAAAANWRPLPIFAAAAVALPIWHLTALPLPQSLSDANQRRDLMKQAVDYIHSSLDPGSPLFVDYQSSILASYYLEPNRIIHEVPGRNGFQDATWGGYHVIISPQWSLDTEAFLSQAARVRAAYRLKPEERLWVFNAGWGVNIFTQLQPQFSSSQSAKSFGESISVFEFLSDAAPELPIPIIAKPAVLRLNAGGESYMDQAGQLWSADAGFSGGDIFRTQNPIRNTPLSPLYTDERYGKSPFKYAFNLPNKDYQVVLRFAEISSERTGQRIFDVILNGKMALKDFDVYAAAGGSQKAIDREFTVPVTDGILSIEFVPKRSSATISAIEVFSK